MAGKSGKPLLPAKVVGPGGKQFSVEYVAPRDMAQSEEDALVRDDVHLIRLAKPE